MNTRPATYPQNLTHDLDGTPYGSKPYRPSPARREFIHGRIEPMDAEPVLPGWSVLLATAFAATFVASFIMGSAS